MLTRGSALIPAVHKDARLLVIDDEQANLDLMDRVLHRVGYENVVLTRDPVWALAHILDLAPDLILLDLHMPVVDGWEVLKRLQTVLPPEDLVPRLVITADATEQTRRAALALGAHDFLTKPIDILDVSLRVANLLETRMLHVRLQGQNDRLEEQVRLRTAELERSHRQLSQRLALVGEYNDDNTAQHTYRVGIAAARLALALGLPPREGDLLSEAAPLHDIGKIAIPDAVLKKPGPLTPVEFEVIKTHTTAGAHILAGGDTDLLRLAEEIAYSHHERWDGTGYPNGLKGATIPPAARLVAVVDVFDALTHARPYKHAWSVDQAVAEMLAERGKQFDPEMLDVFLTLTSTSSDPGPSPDLHRLLISGLPAAR